MVTKNRIGAFVCHILIGTAPGTQVPQPWKAALLVEIIQHAEHRA